jgi:hypothetical protein
MRNGIVSVFDLNGNLLQRLATGGTFNAPWGLTIAPATFDEFSGALLVGNNGDGTISATVTSSDNCAIVWGI